LLSRAAQLNGEISRLCQSKPSRAYGDDDGKWLSAIQTPSDLVLPNPDKPGVMSWPPAEHNFATDNITPILGNPGSSWWEIQQAESARARIEDAKRADALNDDEGRVRNDPKLWRRG
jgi:hypothetical protein